MKHSNISNREKKSEFVSYGWHVQLVKPFGSKAAYPATE